MKYHVGVLHSVAVEEGFGDFHTEREFIPLRPIRQSLCEVEIDIASVPFWIRRKEREEAKFRRDSYYDFRHNERGHKDTYEIYIHVVPDT